MNYTPELVVSVIEEKINEYGTAKALSEAVGLDRGRLSLWKNGKAFPTPETFFKYFPIEEEEPKTMERPKQEPVESIFIADHRQEMIDILCNDLRDRLRRYFKKCFIRVGTMDYHNILVITLLHQVGRDRSNAMFYRKVYPDPIEHMYLDPDWENVVVKDFIKSANYWILKQFTC